MRTRKGPPVKKLDSNELIPIGTQIKVTVDGSTYEFGSKESYKGLVVGHNFKDALFYQYVISIKGKKHKFHKSHTFEVI